MAERERALAPPYGGVFVARTYGDGRRGGPPGDLADGPRDHRAQPLEADLVLIGLQTGGVWIASRLARVVGEVTGHEVVVGTLDVAFYRDDYGLRPVLPEAATDIPVDLSGRTVVLVDDVLFTGRTIRAALGALSDYGRARAVQLAVMVDRGHRELPDPAGLRGPQPADPARRDGRRQRGGRGHRRHEARR